MVVVVGMVVVVLYRAVALGRYLWVLVRTG
jgi:hypothetical protein